MGDFSIAGFASYLGDVRDEYVQNKRREFIGEIGKSIVVSIVAGVVVYAIVKGMKK